MSAAHPSQPGAEATDAGPPKKRRKTVLACDVCRARKTGCDGLRPCCTSCRLRGWQSRCTYQEGQTQAPTVSLFDLYKRVDQLEAALRNTSHTPQAKDGRSEGPSLPDGPQYGLGSHAAFVDEIADAAAGGTSPPGRSQDTTAPASFPLTADAAHRWPASASGSGSGSGSASDGDPRDLSLPPQPLTDALMACYWERIHLMNFVLHRPSFEAAYRRLREPAVAHSSRSRGRTDGNPDIVLYATLNMVLAFACTRYDGLPPRQRDDLADDLYRRSLRLLPVDTLDQASLPVVQCLLLRSYYLLYTPYGDRSWNVGAVALRVAQSIGLDHRTARRHARAPPPPNQLVREMRRRVWCACTILDRLLANTFGRPTMLPHLPRGEEESSSSPLSLPLPALIDDEYLSADPGQEGRQPPDKPARLAFLHHALPLWDILDRVPVLARRYLADPDTARTGSGSMQALRADVDALLQAVDQFVLWLPAFLRDDDDGDDADAKEEESAAAVFRRQAATIKARVLYVRLQILRLVIMVDARRILALQRRDCLFVDLSRQAVAAAHAVLALLHRGQFSGPGQMTFPWHALYYTFAGASVLIAAALFPALHVDLAVEPGKTSWSRAMDLFAFHRHSVATADKACETLQKLRARVEETQKKRTGPLSSAPEPVEEAAPGAAAWTADTTEIPVAKERSTAATPHVPSGISSTTAPDNGAGANLVEDENEDGFFAAFLDFSYIDQSWLTNDGGF